MTFNAAADSSPTLEPVMLQGSTLPAAVDLRFLLPVRAGEYLALLDEGGLLWQVTETGNLSLVHGAAGVLPSSEDGLVFAHLPTACASHLILPELNKAHLAWLEDSQYGEIQRILKPGGWLLLGLQHADSLAQRTRLGQWRGAGFRQPDLQRLLQRCGFLEQYWFGVMGDLQQPRFCVPLERTAISRYFFETLFVPYSPQAAWLPRLTKYLAFGGLQRVLYPGLLVVTRKAGETGARSYA